MAIHHLLLSKSWEQAAALIEDVALGELEKLEKIHAYCVGCNSYLKK